MWFSEELINQDMSLLGHPYVRITKMHTVSIFNVIFRCSSSIMDLETNFKYGQTSEKGNLLAKVDGQLRKACAVWRSLIWTLPFCRKSIRDQNFGVGAIFENLNTHEGFVTKKL